MKTTKTLTQGQLKKVRRRERLAAMTPAERKANDKYRAESKAQAKAQKGSPAPHSQTHDDSFAPQYVNDASRESNSAAIPAETPNNYLGKPAVHLTGKADRQTLAYRPLITVQKFQGSCAQDDEKIPTSSYHYQPRKVRAGKEGDFDRYWNEAVKQKLNPYVYLEEITARRKAEKLTKQSAG
ncbi:hypothetical protein GE278_11765 [Enterobacteriaceae bacterium Kacie_13]|nr:hypothetical protein GE278_11765 [Enterobacteriaceae bacterium Kacie_13]